MKAGGASRPYDYEICLPTTVAQMILNHQP